MPWRRRAPSTNRASSRSAARLAAVQALYQMDMTGIDLNEVIAEFEAHRLGKEIEGVAYRDAEAAFFGDLVKGVVREQLEIDPLIDKQLAEGLAAPRASIRSSAPSCAPAPMRSCRATMCPSAWSSPNMSTSPMRFSATTSPRW